MDVVFAPVRTTVAWMAGGNEVTGQDATMYETTLSINLLVNIINMGGFSLNVVFFLNVCFEYEWILEFRVGLILSSRKLSFTSKKGRDCWCYSSYFIAFSNNDNVYGKEMTWMHFNCRKTELDRKENQESSVIFVVFWLNRFFLGG